MNAERKEMNFHGTTIIAVRRKDNVVVAGDGQITLGGSVVKHHARKVRRIYNESIIVGFAGGNEPGSKQRRKFVVIRNLCTLMAGAEPVGLQVEIQSEATNIMSYTFSLPGSDTLMALWTDGVAVDEDGGVEVNLTFQGFSGQDVTAIDVLVGFQQEMIADSVDGNLVVRDLLVRDYPTILRLRSTKHISLPLLVRGHAR